MLFYFLLLYNNIHTRREGEERCCCYIIINIYIVVYSVFDRYSSGGILGSEFEDTVPPGRLSRLWCYGFSQNGRIMKNRKRKRGATRTTIQLVTFGYKGGVVSGLDRYYDLRRLPNDAWVIDGYKKKMGSIKTLETWY